MSVTNTTTVPGMDLRSYLTLLQQRDLVSCIATEVSTDLEVAALCRREFSLNSGGKALFFEKIKETPVRLAANLFGTRERMLMMLNTEETVLEERISDLLTSGGKDAAQNLTAACRRLDYTEHEPDYLHSESGLDDVPALRSWPGEVHRYLSLALCHTVHQESGCSNLGLYRGALIDDKTIALNFAGGSGADSHLRIAERANKPLPVALILGADPALYWAAAAPLPTDCNEYGFTERISGRAIGMASCLTQPLIIPAEAELIIEGEIRPGARISEGPFGNHRGEYGIRPDCPLMRVTAIRHRVGPIIPATVVGPPPSENIQLAKLNELLLRGMLKHDFPLISDLVMPEMTIFHGAALISLCPCSPADIDKLLADLEASCYLKNSRLLVLLDDDISISRFDQSWWRAINRLSAERIRSVGNRLIVNATGVDRGRLISEDPVTAALVKQRRYSRSSTPSEPFQQ